MLQIAAPRYTKVPFPPYSFVPGRDPHPHNNPAGHRFDAAALTGGPVELPSPARWRESTPYLLGCDLYNHAFWWEAHEAWETLWRLTDRSAAQGRFFKTLIQVAAAHLKLHMGNAPAANGLITRAQRNAQHTHAAASVLPYMGLHLDEWMLAVRRYYDNFLQNKGMELQHNPSTYPFLRLI
ncbi:MAG: DUF309 domain-containing protein [Phycisphaerae bacterium]|nr:DUF309 domain-containing protein [Phycisphaerae bacterium]